MTSLNTQTIEFILYSHEQGLDADDIFDQLDERVDWEDISQVISTYESLLDDLLPEEQISMEDFQ